MGIFDVGSHDPRVVNIELHDSRLVTEFLVTWKSSIIEHQLHESRRVSSPMISEQQDRRYIVSQLLEARPIVTSIS